MPTWSHDPLGPISCPDCHVKRPWFRLTNGGIICSYCGYCGARMTEPNKSHFGEEQRREIRQMAREEAQSVHLEAMSSRLRAERRMAFATGCAISERRRYCETCNDWHICSLDKSRKKS